MAEIRKPLRHFIAPKYWPTWLGLGLLRMSCWLPHPVVLGIGRTIGRMAYHLAGERRAIVRRNLELCFPDIPAADRSEDFVPDRNPAIDEPTVILAGYQAVADNHLTTLTTIEGIDHILNAVNNGKGVILLSAHFTTLEISGRILKLHVPPYDAVYRKHRSELVTEILRTGRERSAAATIEKRDIKSMVRSLRQGRIVWYAPDQSYSRKGAEVVPFFGVPSMHTTATSTLARLGKAVTIPYFPARLPNGRYHIRVLPPLQNFPSDDLVEDTEQYVRVLEEQVRRCPEQYFWVHRKFKGLPDDYPDYYSDLDAAK